MWTILVLTTVLLASFTPIINKRILADADVPVAAWAATAASLPLLRKLAHGRGGVAYGNS